MHPVTQVTFSLFVISAIRNTSQSLSNYWNNTSWSLLSYVDLQTKPFFFTDSSTSAEWQLYSDNSIVWKRIIFPNVHICSGEIKLEIGARTLTILRKRGSIIIIYVGPVRLVYMLWLCVVTHNKIFPDIRTKFAANAIWCNVDSFFVDELNLWPFNSVIFRSNMPCQTLTVAISFSLIQSWIWISIDALEAGWWTCAAFGFVAYCFLQSVFNRILPEYWYVLSFLVMINILLVLLI